MRLLRWLAVPRLAIAFLLTVAATMCSGFLAGEIIAAAGPQERRAMETYNDLLVRVERMAPGFGGMFIDPDGRLAVYLVDTAQLPTAHSAIEAVFGSSQIPAAGLRALQGQYTVSQLKVWTERATALLEKPGVTLVDLDEAKNRVTIGVEDEPRRQVVEKALPSLKIPREAIVIQVTGQIRRVDPRGLD
jgi:hypothetical protein